MKIKIIHALLFVFVSMGFYSCSDESNSDTSTTKTYRRTVIIYIAAQNSLGTQNASTADSAEIAYGSRFLPSTDDNVILFLDDAQAPRVYRFYKSSNGNGYYQTLKRYTTDVSSTDPATLTEVLNLAKTHCPSKSYGLVLWSHGASWLPNISIKTIASSPSAEAGMTLHSFGIDTGTGGDMASDRNADGDIGKQMEITEIASAINQSGLHLDYIFFDACNMQAIEVAYALRNSADYVVGAPTTTSGYGCVYYDQIQNGLFAYPASDDSIRKIVDTYYYDVMENPETKQYYKNQGCVMSVIKTSALENLATATAQYLGKFISDKVSLDLSDLNGYIDYNSTGYPDYYDMAYVMHKYLSEEDYLSWRTELDKCVIYQKASDTYLYISIGNYPITKKVDKDVYSGVSMFIPQTKYETPSWNMLFNDVFKDTEWYSAAGWNQTGW